MKKRRFFDAMRYGLALEVTAAICVLLCACTSTRTYASGESAQPLPSTQPQIQSIDPVATAPWQTLSTSPLFNGRSAHNASPPHPSKLAQATPLNERNPPSPYPRAHAYEPVDHRITAALIAGNPTKYIGHRVRLACSVYNVPRPHIANVGCGPSLDALIGESNLLADPQGVTHALERREETLEQYRANFGQLILTGDVGQLDARQRIIVTGTVVRPVEGADQNGVPTLFPAVEIDDYRTIDQ